MFNELLSEGGLSLDRLKNFCAMAEAGGIARVAGGDPAKQSLYSRQLRELEQFFGAELTRRKGKGIEFTEQGLELARQVRAHLQSLTDFKRACAGRPVEFRIASGNSIVEWLLVPNLAKVTAGAPVGLLFLSEHAHSGYCKRTKGTQRRFWYFAKVSYRCAVEISLDRSDRLRSVRAGGMGEGERGCDDVVETTPGGNICRGRVQQALSGVLRKGEADSKSSIQLCQFHPGRRVGEHRQCRRAAAGNGRVKSSEVGRETI